MKAIALFKKGKVSDALRYNQDFPIEMSGKELKAKIALIMPTYLAKKAFYEAKNAEFLNADTVQPDIHDDYYDAKAYSWELCEFSDNQNDNLLRSVNSRSGIITADMLPKSEAEAMARRNYNSNLYQIKSLSEDIATLQVLIDYVKDSEKRTIPINLLLALEL